MTAQSETTKRARPFAALSRWWPKIRVLISVGLLGVVGVRASDAVVMSLVIVALIFLTSLPGAWYYARYGLATPRTEE